MPICRIYSASGLELRRFNTGLFDSIGEITVGRSSQCDISLKALTYYTHISRLHFVLKREHGEWWIYDRSRVGIVKDCLKIQKYHLHEGDIIRFGQLFLAYGDKAGPGKYDIQWEDSESGDPMTAVVWPGANSIGASRDNYICVREGNISRFHGVITLKEDGRMTFRNINSQLMSRINNEFVTQTQSVDLHEGDRLSMADFSVNVVRGKRQTHLSGLAEVGVPPVDTSVTVRHEDNATSLSHNRKLAIFMLIFVILLLAGVIYAFWKVLFTT
jgi:predicted component of type VI protein secretion system